MSTTRAIFFLSIVAACAFLAAESATGGSITLDFNSLPSAQGWNYFGVKTDGDPLPEASVYSVDGITLTQDMVGGDGDRVAYNILGVLDKGLPTVLRLRARLTDYEPGTGGSRGLGFSVGMQDGDWIWQLNFTDTHMQASGGTFFPQDTTEFHDYRLEASPLGGFRLFIDGVLRETGTGTAISSSSAIAFGDWSGTGENADVEITEFSVTQGIPEPGTFAMWTLAVGLGLVLRRRRRSK